LTPAHGFRQKDRFTTTNMGQQFNKVIKKKRRLAYLKRKKALIKAAKKK